MLCTCSMARRMLLGVLLFTFSAASFGQIAVGISVGVAPSELTVYAQPICPGPGYIWTPGYWGWNDDDGYYWVPGTWVFAPVGMLWTPGYWGWGGGLYVWHAGYWGPHIGFYGGINYGFGYGGVGFVGGEWRGGAFYYNRSVTNVSVTSVTNVYTKTVVVNNTTVNNVSYNGGEGGVKAEPTPQERLAEHDQHTAALAAQTQHEHVASQTRENFASVNQGKPAIAATAKAGDFSSRSAIPARNAGAPYHAPAMSPKEARGPAPGTNRPGNGSASGKSNDGFRPFTPPSSKTSQSRGGSNSGYGDGNRQSEPSSAPKSNPAPASHNPAPQQHKSSPPPAKKQNPPRGEHRNR